MPRYPALIQGMLYSAEGREPIAIGTPTWLAWLKEHTAFIYQDAPLRFTAAASNAPAACTGTRISVLRESYSNGM